jgi:hypothetical protein
MKNIQDLHVVQIRIFPRNTIPYEVFSVSERQKQFKEKFHFSTAQIPFPLLAAGPKVILFESGEIELEERRIIINRLNFEDRKMVLEIVGGSADADAIFGEIASNINVLSNQNRLDEGKCIIKTQETNCAVTLDIDFWDVFSGDMKRFIQNDLSQMIALPTLSINPKKLSFEVTFKQTNEGLQEEGITISRWFKLLKIC